MADGRILYALVARDTTVLSEYSAPGPKDYSNAAQSILNKLPATDSKLTYAGVFAGLCLLAAQLLMYILKRTPS